MFGLIKKHTAIKALATAYARNANLQYYSSALQRDIVVYGYGNQGSQIGAYATSDDLYAIVNKVMKTAAMVPVYEYKVIDQKAYKTYKILEKKCAKNPSNKRLSELKVWHTKALELNPGELQDRLDNPNSFQSKTEFYHLTYLFKLLTGNYYIYKDILGYGQEGGGANAGKPYEIYNLPPNFTYPIRSEELPRRAVGYKFILYRLDQNFELEQVIHGKYVNPVYDFMGNELIGLSPLQAAAKTLTTIENEVDYKNRALINSGAQGAIYSEGAEVMEDTALSALKEDVLKELGPNWQNGSNVNARKLGFLAGKWGYIDLFKSPADMEIIAQSKMTFKKLCNTYGVSDRLFNVDDTAKYDNMKFAVQELYTNASIPLVAALCDDLNKGLAPLYGDSVLGYDLSDIPELQENTNDIATRFNNLPAFRVNDLYEALGFGKLDDPNADIVLIKTGYQPLDDLATPIDTTLTKDYQ